MKMVMLGKLLRIIKSLAASLHRCIVRYLMYFINIGICFASNVDFVTRVVNSIKIQIDRVTYLSNRSNIYQIDLILFL